MSGSSGKHLRVLLSILTVLSLLSPVCRGEETGAVVLSSSSLDLEVLLQEALQRNPELIAAKAGWEAFQKEILASWALPDPIGGYDIMGSMTETRVGPQKNRFMVAQDIPFPLKLWEQRNEAKAEARAAWARYQAFERDITAKLSKLYYELYFIDASLDTLAEIKELLKKFEAAAQARYSSREGSQRDVAKAQTEFSMSLEKLYRLEQERESVTAQINALLDRDPMQPFGKATLPPKPVLGNSLVELVNLAVLHRPAIQEAEAMVSKAHYSKRLAQLAYVPDVNVGFEYVRVGAGTTMEPSDMDGRDSWMFPLKVNLPIWQNRIIPEIQKAAKLEEAERAKLLAVKNQAFFEVKDSYSRFQSASKIADLYDVAIVPQAQLALSADQAGYESGKTDFLDLLDSERIYLNAKLSQIRFYTTALQAYTDLAWAAGLDLKNAEKEKLP